MHLLPTIMPWPSPFHNKERAIQKLIEDRVGVYFVERRSLW